MLEQRLLHKGIAALHADRAVCVDCSRTPLVGERMHSYADGSHVCELCRPLHRGEPERSDRVRPEAAAHHVRVRRAA